MDEKSTLNAFVHVDVGRVTTAGEVAICPSKEIKTTSFWSLPQSSSCYVTATRSGIGESMSLLRVPPGQEAQESPRAIGWSYYKCAFAPLIRNCEVQLRDFCDTRRGREETQTNCAIAIFPHFADDGITTIFSRYPGIGRKMNGTVNTVNFLAVFSDT